MKAWGFFRGEDRVPDARELASVRRRVGCASRHPRSATRGRSPSTPRVSSSILGASPRATRSIEWPSCCAPVSVTAALVSAGGSSVYGLGSPPGRDAWEVKIQDPVDASKVALSVALKDASLSVAGSSEKSFAANGVTYTHIMDPRTGRAGAGDAERCRRHAERDRRRRTRRCVLRAGNGCIGQVSCVVCVNVDVWFFLPAANRLVERRSQACGDRMMFGRVSRLRRPRSCARFAPVPESQDVTPAQEAAPFAPRRYVAYRTPAPIVSDGKLAEPAWAAAPWTEAFVDIEGDSRPRPPLQTRVKMLWDDDELLRCRRDGGAGPVGNVEARDAVIFHDNDFEVFIDPDGDTHAYYELEVNVARHALGLDAAQALSRWRPRHRRVGHRRPAGRHRRSWHA